MPDQVFYITSAILTLVKGALT